MALSLDIEHMGSTKATLIGLTAVLFWSSFIGMLRYVAEHLGPTLGPACCYTAASILLVILQGRPRLSAFPRRWIIVGCLLFIAYEVSLALALGFAQDGRQAIEISMLNYLWPAFTILFAVLFNGRKASLLLWPGVIVAMAGVCFVVGGDGGFALSSMAANMARNPIGYGIGFGVAVIWGVYCTVAVRMSGGQTSVTPFIMATAAALWLFHLVSAPSPAEPDISLPTIVALAFAAVPIGWGYTAWNIGIIRGSVTVLAVSSYFIPVLSSAFSAALLGATLCSSFWQGAGLVTAGSLLCWYATYHRN